ncbi:MAG: protein kinase [Actinomycetota bacterium]|nr:protein kinase [Actinomycetota bacterium]
MERDESEARFAPTSAPGRLELPGYQVGEVVGRGGFGVVFAARDEAFNRKVAIKVLSLQFDDDAHARFNHERLAMGAVSGHPNIVDVYASGFDPLDRPYLVMEYMTGGSFAQRLRRRGPMKWEAAVDAGIKLAGALETAHRAGVLHRDIKPENVLVSAYGEPQLADFGISHIENDPALLTSGAPTFTPLYAAPEVLNGGPSSPASEVYSLAATVFALIAGKAAFQNDDDEHPVALLYRIATEQLPDLRALGVPGAVAAVIERAMTKDPIRRQRSAAQLGNDLRDAQTSLGLSPTAMHILIVTVSTPSSIVPIEDEPSGGARPGSRLASRPMHFIWIVDCSGSMAADGKIEALNRAIRDALPSLREVAADNPHAQVLVRCLAFSTGIEWVIATPTPAEEVASVALCAGGSTDMGAALVEVARQMRVPPMEPRALPPALVLVSDGRPTDDVSSGLERLLAEPWGAKAVRLAIAIGRDADHGVLTRFIAHPDIMPLRANNADELVHFVRWASTIASRIASSPIAEHTLGSAVVPQPLRRRRDGTLATTW